MVVRSDIIDSGCNFSDHLAVALTMKKHSEVTQTLRAGCSKADPQTNTQTDRGDYNTLCSLACSVINCNLGSKITCEINKRRSALMTTRLVR